MNIKQYSNAKDILLAAARLISRPGRWTRGTGARDKRGRLCEIEKGMSFCAFGAICRVAQPDWGGSFTGPARGLVMGAAHAAAHKHGYSDFIDMNDNVGPRGALKMAGVLREAAATL